MRSQGKIWIAAALLGLICGLAKGVLAQTTEASVQGDAIPSGADLSRTVIDISSWNPYVVPASDAVRNLSVELIFHRVSIGLGTTDKSFTKEKIAPFYGHYKMGAYHALYPNHTGAQQADEFIDKILDVCSPGYPVLLAVDWERVCVKDKVTHQCKVESAPALVVDQFLDEVSKRTGGVRAIVYTGPNALRDHGGEIAQTKITNSPLWFATYYQQFWRRADGSAKDNAVNLVQIGKKTTKTLHVERDIGYIVPLPGDVAPWRDWTLWQFSGGHGPNVTSNITLGVAKHAVDMSFFNGSREGFRRFVARSSWNPSGCKGLTPPPDVQSIPAASTAIRDGSPTQGSVPTPKALVNIRPGW